LKLIIQLGKSIVDILVSTVELKATAKDISFLVVLR
jgi:hypothetical protein